MKKFLILAIASCTAWLVQAQNPTSITLPKGPVNYSTPAPDVPCNNFAGTFTLGASGVNTQSNDLTLDTIWLCHRDSIFIDHNGDFNLSGDPQPSTPPGVGYAFYSCAPTITGPTLQAITGSALPPLPGDPCRLVNPGNPFDLLVTSGNPNGDTWFFNSGFLQTTFNSSNPFLLHFAPVTFDDALNNGYEIDPAVPGSPPGPCVNVNTAAQFEVVYLNPIEAVGITTPYNGNSCLGRFRIQGGYAEWDQTQNYDLDIHLQSDPNVKGLINNPLQQIKHGVSIVFSVPQAGVYVVQAQDGKSCGLDTLITMGTCDNADNVIFTIPDVEAAPGETICVPITTSNFSNIQGFSFSMQWDPTMLELASPDFVQNWNGDLVDFDPIGNTEISLSTQGFLGIAYNGSVPATLTSVETLLEVCFNVITLEDSICSPLVFTNNPTAVSVGDGSGNPFAFEPVNGQFCSVYDTLAVDVQILTPNCDGTSNVQVTATGGEGPYEIIWQCQPSGATPSIDNILPGQAVTLPNLPPCTYKITVTPQNGIDTANAAVVFVTITSSTLGAALDLSQLPSCNGASDGEVTAVVFEGNTQVTDLTGYTFQWAQTGLPNPTGPVQTGIPAGQYTVTVTNSNGCTAVAAGTLGNPAVLDNGVVTITPATCTGVPDGTISYEMEGGTPNATGGYHFEVYYSEIQNDPNPPTLIASNDIGNPWGYPAAYTGFYQISVTDENGCTYTDEIFVPATIVVNINEVIADYMEPNCNGGTDGQLGAAVTLTPNQPGAIFTFSWTPSGDIVSTGNTSSQLQNIGAGIYTVDAVDANGCAASTTIELNEPGVFTVASVSSTNPTCVNPAGGSIAVIGQGGTGGPATFTYLWSTGATTTTINGLMEGIYTVTATDANSCSAVLTDTLMLPPPPSITGIAVQEVRCGGDGSLTVSSPTGVNYFWTLEPLGTPVGANATIANLDGGTYVVVVVDINSCTATDTVTLAGVEPLVIDNATLTNPSCFGYTDGSIAIGVSGGTPGYSYNWNPTVTPGTDIAFALASGIYNVTVTDTKDCTVTEEYILMDPPQIQVIVTAIQPTSCFGSCDGGATLLVNYPPNNDFNYVWDPGGSMDSVRVDLCSGINTVTITETSTNQCFIITEVNVPSPTPVAPDPNETSLNPVTCNGGSDGQIIIAPGGGNGAPYFYSWPAPITATGNVANNLPAGTYVLTLTDKDGCSGEYPAVVTEPDPVVVSIDASGTKELQCFGDDDGALAVLVMGGNTDPSGQFVYTYQWQNEFGDVVGNTNPLEMLEAGTYLVTVTDFEGCTGTTMLPLNNPQPVGGAYQLGAPIECFDGETSLEVTNVFGGSGAPYRYSVDFGVPLDTSFVSTVKGGERKITYIDSQGCETTDTITINQPPQIIVTFDPASIEIELGDSLRLTPLISGAAVSTFEWMPADYLINPDTLQPMLYTFESGILMLTVYDDKGCFGKGSLMVEVDPNRNVYIPNIFIPGNSDGTNDYFTPFVGVGVEKINYMRVYDRWGELLYSKDSFLPNELELTSGWDGRYKGKLVNPGVYVYVIEVLFVDGRKLLYRGDVTVAR